MTERAVRFRTSLSGAASLPGSFNRGDSFGPQQSLPASFCSGAGDSFGEGDPLPMTGQRTFRDSESLANQLSVAGDGVLSPIAASSFAPSSPSKSRHDGEEDSSDKGDDSPERGSEEALEDFRRTSRLLLESFVENRRKPGHGGANTLGSMPSHTPGALPSNAPRPSVCRVTEMLPVKTKDGKNRMQCSVTEVDDEEEDDNGSKVPGSFARRRPQVAMTTIRSLEGSFEGEDLDALHGDASRGSFDRSRNGRGRSPGQPGQSIMQDRIEETSEADSEIYQGGDADCLSNFLADIDLPAKQAPKSSFLRAFNWGASAAEEPSSTPATSSSAPAPTYERPSAIDVLLPRKAPVQDTRWRPFASFMGRPSQAVPAPETVTAPRRNSSRGRSKPSPETVAQGMAILSLAEVDEPLVSPGPVTSGFSLAAAMVEADAEDDAFAPLSVMVDRVADPAPTASSARLAPRPSLLAVSSGPRMSLSFNGRGSIRSRTSSSGLNMNKFLYADELPPPSPASQDRHKGISGGSSREDLGEGPSAHMTPLSTADCTNTDNDSARADAAHDGEDSETWCGKSDDGMELNGIEML